MSLFTSRNQSRNIVIQFSCLLYFGSTTIRNSFILPIELFMDTQFLYNTIEFQIIPQYLYSRFLYLLYRLVIPCFISLFSQMELSRKGRASNQVGFPPLFICMVALICVVLGFILHH